MQPILEAHGIGKSFPGVRALHDVHLSLQPRELLAVVGENGAGKSTLMKILCGVHSPDEGEVILDGEPIRLHGVHHAEQNGIVLIHQELNLAEHLDVAGNVFLGREPTWGGPLRLISSRIYSETERITRRLGLACSPRTSVVSLMPGQQQLVEIARALSLQSRILILDEPTSSLTQRETERLFDVIHDLKQDGISIIYISHRLQEVMELADRVTVLRDGENAGELQGADIAHDKIVRLMVGRELTQFFHRTRADHFADEDDPPVFEAHDVRWSRDQRDGISFTCHGGEIVGMAGLMGAGRTELAETIFGIRTRVSGDLWVDGNLVMIRKPADAISAGIFLVPEDRRLHGLLLTSNVRNNISLPSMKRVSRWSLVLGKLENEMAAAMKEKLNIRTPTVKQIVQNLSGGNQQKVVLAKWLSQSPRLLILDEPTRGIDVGAKSEIYALMDDLAHQGVAVLMISSDLEEILGMSDRVLVMHEGRLAGELTREKMTEESIMHLATGGRNA